MSYLNTNVISKHTEVDPIPVPMDVDLIDLQFGINSSLPIDVARIIFQNLKADLPQVAWVCKNWKVIADDKVLRDRIRPAQAFGAKEWQDYIGVDAGTEPPLPRCAYKDLDDNGGLLTFIPEKVRVTKKNGVVEEVPLDSLEIVGNLVKNPKKGNKTGYDPTSWAEAIKNKIKPEKSHWVWIKKEFIGGNLSYYEQQDLAKELGEKISGLMDTAISVFMHNYVRGQKLDFMWKTVRVNEMIDNVRLYIGYRPSGPLVNYYFDNSHNYGVGIALARKSLPVEVLRYKQSQIFCRSIAALSEHPLNPCQQD